jgi:hypothetical protein
MTDTARKHRRAALYLIATFALLTAVCLLAWHSFGRRNSIVLDEGTQSVTSSSWKFVPINAPYGGNLDVSVRVISGDSLNVTVIDEDQMARLHNCLSLQTVSCKFNFAAVNTSIYTQNSRIHRGHYFLVLADASLSGLSPLRTDVAFKITLDPKTFAWI